METKLILHHIVCSTTASGLEMALHSKLFLKVASSTIHNFLWNEEEIFSKLHGLAQSVILKKQS